MSFNSLFKIAVVSYNNVFIHTDSTYCEFSADEKITIGRGVGNHLTLDDPSRVISRVQASLSPKDASSVFIDNLSASTSVFINTHELCPGESGVLHCKDSLLIGDYVLQLKQDKHALEVNVCSSSQDSVEVKQSPGFIPDDVDFFYDDQKKAASISVQDPLALLLSGFSDQSLVTPDLDRTPEVESLFVVPRPVQLKMVDPIPDKSIATIAGQQDNNKQESIPKRILNGSVNGASTYDDCRVAFARALQIDIHKLPEFTPAFFEQLGGVLLHLTGGTVHMMHERAQIKHEMRADVTIIAASGNNPLKFAPDAESAITHLLSEPMPGFMCARDAIDDAMDDLLAHQIGLLSGARTAVYEVVKNFSPEKIQKYLVTKNIIDAFLPMSKKSRLWELYETHYAEVAGCAREEFELRFQQAFAQAYEQEIDRMCEARESA